MKHLLFSLFAIFSFSHAASAQNFTGSWRGNLNVVVDECGVGASIYPESVRVRQSSRGSASLTNSLGVRLDGRLNKNRALEVGLYFSPNESCTGVEYYLFNALNRTVTKASVQHGQAISCSNGYTCSTVYRGKLVRRP